MHRCDGVERDDAISVAGIDQHQVAGAKGREVLDEGLRQIAVRIQDGRAAPGIDVLDDNVLEQGRLAPAGLADGEDVGHSVPLG